MQLRATSRSDLRTRPARERILLTAHDLFYRQGIRSTGIDTVIARAVSEIAPALPRVTEITRRHKAQMQQAIAALLPDVRRRRTAARSLALVIDGSIVQAQFCSDPEVVLRDLRRLVKLIGGDRAHLQSSL